MSKGLSTGLTLVLVITIISDDVYIFIHRGLIAQLLFKVFFNLIILSDLEMSFMSFIFIPTPFFLLHETIHAVQHSALW